MPIRTINTIATEQPGGDGVLYPLGRPALSREEAGYAGDAPTSASAEPSGSAPTGLATGGSAPASQPSGSPPVASPPFPPLAGKTPPATRAPARPLVLSGGFLDPSALGVSGPSGAGDTKPIVVKLTVGGVLVSSPKRKASATQGTRGVTDDVELRRRMALDGWTTEEKTRPGTQHVDRYFLPPPTFPSQKKLRSLVEVARVVYPQFLQTERRAVRRRHEPSHLSTLAALLAERLAHKAEAATADSPRIVEEATALAFKYKLEQEQGRMVYAEKAGDGLYRSRAQLCRALGLASDDAPPGEGSHVDVWWDGGVGGWYAALVVEAGTSAARSLVRYEDGFEERLDLAPEPWAGPGQPRWKEGETIARWRPSGVRGDDSDGHAFLEFEPLTLQIGI